MESTNGEKGYFEGKAGPGRTPGVPQVKRNKQLLDMEHVYRTNKEGQAEYPDDTAGQALFRQMCREDVGKFLTMLNKLRADYQLRRDKAKVKEEKQAQIVDEGSKGVVALIDQLLTEWEGVRNE